MSTLRIEESNGDYLEAYEYAGRGLTLDVNNPWAGDTETGLHREAAITLTWAQVVELVAFLQGWVAAQAKKQP